jgi:hypothetical protein
MALASARFTAFRAVAVPQQSILDLLLGHALLDPLQDQLAFAQGETEGFHHHLIALDPRRFLDVFVAGSVHYYQLKSEFDARFSIAGSAVVSSWLWAGERFTSLEPTGNPSRAPRFLVLSFRLCLSAEAVELLPVDANDKAQITLPAQNGAKNVVEIRELHLIVDRDQADHHRAHLA